MTVYIVKSAIGNKSFQIDLTDSLALACYANTHFVMVINPLYKIPVQRTAFNDIFPVMKVI